MQLSLELGTIDIIDQEVASFVKNKSLNEIKALFVNLIKNQITNSQVSEDSLDYRLKNLKVINPEKGKRVRDALDSLNKKLEPLKDMELSEVKESYLKEKFSR